MSGKTAAKLREERLRCGAVNLNIRNKMLDPQQLQTAIISYVEDKEAEYAVAIAGEWGSGKTYFLKTKLIPTLKEKNKRVIYISLYGVKSVDEIEQKVFCELINLPEGINVKKSDVSAIGSETIKLVDSLSKNIDLGKTSLGASHFGK
ncbi:MAG: P-loop NTPase fold protein [Cyanobacteria bacterium J06621_12]